MTPPPTMPRRLGPRPLPLHLAIEGWILQMSLSGLIASSGAWPLSNPRSRGLPPWNTPDLTSLAALAREVVEKTAGVNHKDVDGPWGNALAAAPFLAAVTRQAQHRLEAFTQGVRVYQAHPYRRTVLSPPAVWRRGVAHVLDYASDATGPPVLFVPSLINRAYILDLAPDRSLMRAAAAAGLHAFLLDWGEPGEAERAFAAADYIEGALIPAVEEVRRRTGQAPRLVGYCMGGTFTTAAAVLRPDLISGMALLAAPWDFHVESEASRLMMELSRPAFEMVLDVSGCAPADLLQAMFTSLDPTLVGRKFRNFATLDPQSDQAQRFVELEDWLNDGVPLAAPVARECLFGWYGANEPANGQWHVGGTRIDPARIAAPTLCFVPTQDRIVPPASARRLAQAIPNSQVHVVDLGHIGMMAGGSAPKRVYAPLIDWLRRV